MRVDGEWALFSDGEQRPIVRGSVITLDGLPAEIVFLIDTGADRTVFSKDIFDVLGLAPLPSTEQIAGVGGHVNIVDVEAAIRLVRDDGGFTVFRSRYKAAVDPSALDMSVLGRDILGLFALIVDQAGNTVCLINQNHQYRITSS